MSQKTWQELTAAYERADREADRISRGPIPEETEPRRIWAKALSEAISARDEIGVQQSQFAANTAIKQDNILVGQDLLEDVVDELVKLMDNDGGCLSCRALHGYHKNDCNANKIFFKIKSLLEEA